MRDSRIGIKNIPDMLRLAAKHIHKTEGNRASIAVQDFKDAAKLLQNHIRDLEKLNKGLVQK